MNAHPLNNTDDIYEPHQAPTNNYETQKEPINIAITLIATPIMILEFLIMQYKSPKTFE